ncbi:uncharacterized protein LOC142765437 isoform X2 [Rhipicephalus microplus]|uniref:uncharacterized protein LOC142765437 isoform X2 n=1 Tax=Rhipicephalus microplus TaxID=6941 RepID=UPI003F6A8686
MRSPSVLRIIFLVHLATAKASSDLTDSAAGQTSAPLSIKQFLNTTDPIWTYNSTENTTILCKVDQKIGITNESYSFNWSYYSGYLNSDVYGISGGYKNDIPTALLHWVWRRHGVRSLQASLLDFTVGLSETAKGRLNQQTLCNLISHFKNTMKRYYSLIITTAVLSFVSRL